MRQALAYPDSKRIAKFVCRLLNDSVEFCSCASLTFNKSNKKPLQIQKEMRSLKNFQVRFGKVFGSLETKYKVPEYGLTFSEKWNTDNTLFTDVTHSDKLLKGLKLTFEGTFAPQSGNKTGKVKAAYGHELVQVNSDVNLDLAGPIINASAVVGYEGWLAGYQTAFDTQKTKLVTNNFALAYTNKELAVTTTVKDGQEFNGSIFHKVNDDLNAGVQLAWTSGSNATKFGIGAQYALDKNSSVRGKISNDSLIGLGFQTKIRSGVLLSLSTLVDGKNFNSGGHKVGIALELEA